MSLPDPMDSQEHYRELRRKHALRLFLTYLVPLIVLTAYFFLLYGSIVEQGSRVRLMAVVEGQSNMLDLFLFERVEDLSRLIDSPSFEIPPTPDQLEVGLEELKRNSLAFVDLGFIASSGVQSAYAGPFPSLRAQDYTTEPWYEELLSSISEYLVTDVYLGFRRRPHITIAVKRFLEKGPVVLKASLAPDTVYERISYWEGARDIRISIVNKEGFRQLVTPGAGALLEVSPVLPPESPRIGTGNAHIDEGELNYAYSWLRVVDWALMAYPSPTGGAGLFSGLGARVLGIAGVMVLIGVAAVTVGARKLALLQMESDTTRAQLAERVKELGCLLGISRLVEKPGLSLDEILRATVNLIREAWRYPSITCAKIAVEEREFKTEPWEETKWKQVSGIVVDRKLVGVLEVCYMEERPHVHEGPFLKEERELIDAVAERVGRILERRRSAERQSLLTTAIEQAAESVTITDIEGRIQYVNPAFSKISGYTRGEVIGENPRILKSGKHDRAFYEELWKTILAGRTWEGRFINKKKDGTFYEVDCKISPVRDQRGNITNFVAVNHDVTEMVKLENNLRQALKMEAVGQLAGGVAHDFNNLLTVILTNAHYMLKGIDETSPLRHDVEEIKQSGERAAALTRQLLAFSRQQVLEPRIVDLNQVLDGTEKMLRRLIGEHIELETLAASDLGLVYVDPAQVEQVILNLAVNGRDAMPSGGKLSLETENVFLNEDYARLHDDVQSGWYAMLSVSDMGCGMDEVTLSRMFEPFFTTKEPGKGTGLGLSTVYGIVKQCEGHIRVQSEVGKGTIFKIYFPRVVHEERRERMSGLGKHRLDGSETILVVEDDDTVRKTVVRILREHHYSVLEARNGREALDLCAERAGTIDLLITDVVMPEMGGGELSELVAQDYPGIKILFMSGYGKSGGGRRELSGKKPVFVRKPLIPGELARKVRELIEGN